MPIIKQQELFVPMFTGGGSRGGYTAEPANFDGNTYLTRGGALTGVSDSKVWSGSIWLRHANTTFCRIMNSTNDRFSFLGNFLVNSACALFGFSAAAAEILDLRFTISEDTEWHHILWSVDLATSTAHVYVDDAEATLTTEELTDDSIDFTDTDLGIGSNPAGNNKFSGDMADVWMRFGGDVIDFSVEANRRLFIDADGKPVNPTNWPSGGQIQLYGSVDDWHTNKGSGEGFTENGALLEGTGPVQLGSP